MRLRGLIGPQAVRARMRATDWGKRRWPFSHVRRLRAAARRGSRSNAGATRSILGMAGARPLARDGCSTTAGADAELAFCRAKTRSSASRQHGGRLKSLRALQRPVCKSCRIRVDPAPRRAHVPAMNMPGYAEIAENLAVSMIGRSGTPTLSRSERRCPRCRRSCGRRPTGCRVAPARSGSRPVAARGKDRC